MNNCAQDFDLVLASSSPRRRDLLSEAGISFRAIEPGAAEETRPGESAREHVERNARIKAEWVAERISVEDGRTVVLAADTIVALERRILGKPRDADQAREMLSQLSGKTHEVLTGVCIMSRVSDGPWNRRNFVERTRVTFKPLTQRQIDAYVATGSPSDKAGAYAIQDEGGEFVERTEGSYSNVVGLPMERLLAELRAM